MDAKTRFVQWVNTLAAEHLDPRYRRELAKAVIGEYMALDKENEELKKGAADHGERKQ